MAAELFAMSALARRNLACSASCRLASAFINLVTRVSHLKAPAVRMAKKGAGDISKDNDLPPVAIDSVAFRSLIVQALGSLHGKIGSAINVDVIKFDPVSMEVIIRVKERGLVKLWSALTLLSSYQDRKCAVRVIQVSPHLLSLAVDSRQWKTKKEEGPVAS